MRSSLMWQSYCDWCYDELTAESMVRSQQLGLCDRGCCVCDVCSEQLAYLRPPRLWPGPAGAWTWTGDPSTDGSADGRSSLSVRQGNDGGSRRVGGPADPAS
jgi:hypothetical protein